VSPLHRVPAVGAVRIANSSRKGRLKVERIDHFNIDPIRPFAPPLRYAVRAKDRGV